MGSLGFVFSQLIYQLPVAVVAVIGFALIPGRRARIGARRANLAMAGLGALALEMVGSSAWSAFARNLIMAGNFTGPGFRYAAFSFNLFLAILFTVGLALLVAAAVSPTPDPAAAAVSPTPDPATPEPPGPYEPAAPAGAG